MTAIQNRTDNPVAHLSDEDIEEMGQELDAIREQVLSSLGERDAEYIRRMVEIQRKLELTSRATLLFSLLPPAWVAGTAGLAVTKILENMELGHNIMHGQWDWMRDPAIHSTTWEWDNAAPSELWMHSHNQLHHNYTNVLGKDKDLGYGAMRVDEDQPWHPFYLGQPLWDLINSILFEYSIAIYDLEIAKQLKGRGDRERFEREGKKVLAKMKTQIVKDYLLFPMLSGPSAGTTLTANLTANVVRNVWTHAVIICGHFPEGLAIYTKSSIEDETQGEWYLRQMVVSSNISGGPLLHTMTGHLSYHIEHHLYPDLPSNRYPEIAPKVREVFDRYDLTYSTGSFPKQFASALGKVVRLALPNKPEETAAQTPVNQSLGTLVDLGNKVRQALAA